MTGGTQIWHSWSSSKKDTGTAPSLMIARSSGEVWVCRQRNYKKNHSLAPDRKEKMDAIGFDWEGPRERKKEGLRRDKGFGLSRR